MKLLRLSLLATAATVAMGGAALADPPKPTVVFNAGVASNYLFRGVSQTAGGVEGFGGADFTYGPVYAGVWASNVNFQGNSANGDLTDIETDIYGGVSPQFAGFTWTLGGIYYAYWNTPSALPGTDNYFELKAAVSKAVGPVTMGFQYFHSWEFPQSTGAANYYEGDLAYAFTPKLTGSAAFGYQDLDNTKVAMDHYTTWNLGLTYAITDHVSVDGRYTGVSSGAKAFYGTNQSGPFNASDRFVATLKATF